LQAFFTNGESPEKPRQNLDLLPTELDVLESGDYNFLSFHKIEDDNETDDSLKEKMDDLL